MMDPTQEHSAAQSAQLFAMIEGGAVHRITQAAADETNGKFMGDEDQATLFLLMKATVYFFALLVVRRGVKMRFWKYCSDEMGKDMRRYVPMIRKSLDEKPMEQRKAESE